MQSLSFANPIILIWRVWSVYISHVCLHTLALTAGDKQASVLQSFSPHGPQVNKSLITKCLGSYYTHKHTWVKAGRQPLSVSIWLRLFFLIQSCPFIIQSWETKVWLACCQLPVHGGSSTVVGLLHRTTWPYLISETCKYLNFRNTKACSSCQAMPPPCWISFQRVLH